MTLETRRRDDFRPDPRLLQALSGALFLGVIAMLSLPAARSHSVVFGSLPLWLVGLPLVALIALSMARFARGSEPLAASAVSARRRLSARMQASRRGPVPARTRAELARAA